MLQVKSDTEMQSEVYDITTSEQTDPLVHVHHVYMISQNSSRSIWYHDFRTNRSTSACASCVYDITKFKNITHSRRTSPTHCSSNPIVSLTPTRWKIQNSIQSPNQHPRFPYIETRVISTISRFFSSYWQAYIILKHCSLVVNRDHLHLSSINLANQLWWRYKAKLLVTPAREGINFTT